MNKLSALATFVLAFVIACGSDDKSVVLVNLTAEGVTVDEVTITLTPAGGSAVSRSFAWGSSATLSVGVYVPEGTSGVATAKAVGKAAGAVVAESAEATVTLAAAATAGSVALTLRRISGGGLDGGSSPPDAGAPRDGAAPADAVVDAGGADGSVDRAPPSADVGPEAPPIAAPMWRPTENIENDPVSASYRPHVAVNPTNGNGVVVWVEDAAVKARPFTASTGTWGTIKTLDARGEPLDAQVGIDANGRAIVVWYQSGQLDDAALRGVWTTQSTDGISWAPPTRIAQGRVYYEMAFAVARNGSARVAWQDSQMNINSLWSVFFDGNAWGTPATVQTGADSYEREPRLALNTNAAGILIWNNDDATGNDSVWGAVLNGATVGTPALVDNYTADDIYMGAVAVNPDGRGIVAWTQRIPAGPTAELWVNHYVPATGWSGPQKVHAASWVSTPAVAVDRTGNVTMTFTQPITGGRDNVFHTAQPLGGAWAAPMALETENYAELKTDQDAESRLGVDAQGNVIALWRRREKQADPWTWGVYSARKPAGGTWTMPQKLHGIDGLKAFQARLATADNGVTIASWYYGDPGQTKKPEIFQIFSATFR